MNADRRAVCWSEEEKYAERRQRDVFGEQAAQ